MSKEQSLRVDIEAMLWNHRTKAKTITTDNGVNAFSSEPNSGFIMKQIPFDLFIEGVLQVIKDRLPEDTKQRYSTDEHEQIAFETGYSVALADALESIGGK